MDGNRNWMQAFTLVLCAVLLGLNLWQGHKIEALRQEMWSARSSVMDDVRSVSRQVSALSSRIEEGEKLVRDWELAPAGIDKASNSLLTEVSLNLKEWGEGTEVRLTAHQGSGTRIVSLKDTGTGRFSGDLPVSLAGEALSLEVCVDSGGTSRQEELGGWDDIAMLLPLRITGTGYAGPTYRDGVFSLNGYTVDLTDQSYQPAAAAEPSFYLQRNGETVWEAEGVMPEDDWAASGLSREEAREAGFLRDGAYTPCKPLEAECQSGDTVALFFTCRDEYGLKYTFPLERWEIDPGWMSGSHSGSAGGGGSNGPAASPVLSWD